MPNRISTTGSELFIVDNSDADWKVARYLHDWCQISKAIDCATGNFEIGALLALHNEWQKVDQFRILMGSEVIPRTKHAFLQAFDQTKQRLDQSIEIEKEKNEFLEGVPEVVEGLRSGKIECRAYRKEKFHAKAYITHARMDVVGSAALVGSSNFSFLGLTENIELNVQICRTILAMVVREARCSLDNSPISLQNIRLRDGPHETRRNCARIFAASPSSPCAKEFWRG